VAYGDGLENRCRCKPAAGSNPVPSVYPEQAKRVEGLYIPTNMEEKWFFYIVKCRDGSYYSGITNNIEQRTKEHNTGKGAKYTYSRRPVTLVCFEKYPNKSEARKREIQIKNWSRVKKEQLILGFPRLRSG
jgi:putative endonuclease